MPSDSDDSSLGPDSIGFSTDRFAKEAEVMDDRFPEAELYASDGELLGWVVELTVRGTTYRVLIAYPDEYPRLRLELYLLDPELDPEETPHLRADGSMDVSFRLRPMLARKATPATAAARAGAWLDGYERWDREGTWESTAAVVDEAGVVRSEPPADETVVTTAIQGLSTSPTDAEPDGPGSHEG
jgi:hypothetical protein